MRELQKLLCFTLCFLCSCKSQDPVISPKAANYLTEVISLMENNSVNRNKIDWIDFEAKVFEHAKDVKTIEDTYPSVHYAIELLGDKHSYFNPVNSNDTGGDAEPPVLKDEIVPNNIGYIRMGYCMGTHEQKQQYINKIHNAITSRDNDNLRGWIIDLRGNFGGDMSPMLISAAPFLGEGIAGYTAYPDGRKISWSIENGNFLYDGNGPDEPFQQSSPILQKANPYVAILTDTLTASSGEALAIAFKGRAKTRSFGAHTYGVSTANQGFTLSDGSRMLLTVASFCDRNRKIYGGQVVPDEEIVPEMALHRAIAWLQSRE